MQYYFEERFDLVQFARVVKDAGLYLMLRIGPFVAAEWNFGSASLPFTVLVQLCISAAISSISVV